MIRKKISDKEAYLEELRNTLEREELTIKVYRVGKTPAIFQQMTRSYFGGKLTITHKFLTSKAEIRSGPNGVWNRKVVYAS